jgi:prepilin-type N-terminal cleavage/methylation domain-containing protein
MRRTHSHPRNAGFTLAEMLVAMALLAVLAAAVVPSILNQVNKGEVNRVAQDLRAVGNSTKLFYSDVQRWPASLTSLTVAPTKDSTDITGVAIGAGLADRWSGPYLESVVANTDSLRTGFAGAIQRTFVRDHWTSLAVGDTFLVLNVSGLTADDARKVSKVLDGDTSTTKGAVRYDATGKLLKYFATPKNLP